MLTFEVVEDFCRRRAIYGAEEGALAIRQLRP